MNSIRTMTLAFYTHQTASDKQPKVGDVAKKLLQLLDAKIPVPKGFIVSLDSYRAFFAENKLKQKIIALLTRVDPQNTNEIRSASHTITKLIMEAPFPAQSSETLLEASLKLGQSEAMLTASPIQSTPNTKIDTLYNLLGEANILLGIRKLYAAQFSPEALFLLLNRSELIFPQMAVCVQSQPDLKITGILHTSDAQDKTAIYIQMMTRGGKDEYWLKKNTGELIEVRQTKSRLPKLGLPQFKLLAQIAQKLQQILFFPQEALFAFDGKDIFILSTHEETSDGHQSSSSVHKNRQQGVLLKGVSATPGIVTGQVHLLQNQKDTHVRSHEIAVARSFTHVSPEVFKQARGIIVEDIIPTSSLMQMSLHGLALMMDAPGAFSMLTPGSIVTIHSEKGHVISGTIDKHDKEKPVSSPKLATHIGAVYPLGFSKLTVHDIANGSVILNPQKLIAYIETSVLCNKIYAGLKQASEAFPMAPLLYEFGTPSSTDDNQGLVGASLFLAKPELIIPQTQALTMFYHQYFHQNLGIIIPYPRVSYEITRFVAMLKQKNIVRSSATRLYVDLSVPALAWQIPQFSTLVDGIVLDLDMIYSHLFAHDALHENVRIDESEMQLPLFSILEKISKDCQNEGMHLILRGKLATTDWILRFALKHGISEVCAHKSQLALLHTRLSFLEEENINHV